MKRIRRTALVVAATAALVVGPVAPVWAEPSSAMAAAPQGDHLISFLMWWTAAAIVVGSAISAVIVRRSYHVH